MLENNFEMPSLSYHFKYRVEHSLTLSYDPISLSLFSTQLSLIAI